MKKVILIFSSLRFLLSVSFISLIISGCSLTKLPLISHLVNPSCNNHTYINLMLRDYVSKRFDEKTPARMAIIPFDVQESFAPAGNDSLHFGRDLANNFVMEFHKQGVVPIVELFERDRWPGKRAEFFAGNYQAISIARAAGYDLVMIGYLEALKDPSDFIAYIKIIDTQNNMTIWSSKTEVHSHEHDISDALSKVDIAKRRNDLFDFTGLTKQLVYCAVDEIVNSEEVSR